MIAKSLLTLAAAVAAFFALAEGQTFQRLGGCPTLGESVFAVILCKRAYGKVQADIFLERLCFPS